MVLSPVEALAVILVAILVWAGLVGALYAVLWILDRLSGWIHRRNARRRPWR